jgi:hemolysin III
VNPLTAKDPDQSASRPRLRGRLHQIAFLVAVPAGVAVIVSARHATARTAAVIYACGLAGLYGISSSYHRLARSPRARYWMCRLDHSMIYVFIAASFTPFGLVVLRGPWALTLLVGVWAGAMVGVALKLVRMEPSAKVGFALYLILGWSVVAALPQVVRALPPAELALLIGGGLLYSAGAVILATHRPDPVPAVFGYHEVWHAMVVAASGCQYLVIRSVLAASR